MKEARKDSGANFPKGGRKDGWTEGRKKRGEARKKGRNDTNLPDLAQKMQGGSCTFNERLRIYSFIYIYIHTYIYIWFV